MNHATPITPPPSSASNRAAFTLIELLCVVAIVGILAAILFPAISSVRAAASDTRCKANVRQWGQMFILYATDHKGAYTWSGWADDASNGPYTPYYANGSNLMSQLRVCPTLPSSIINAGSTSPTYVTIRGSVNGNINTLLANNSDNQLSRAANPSQFLMLCDSMPNNGSYMTGSATSINSLVGPLFSPSTAASGQQIYASRHGGDHINGVFGDGSVRRITGSPATSGDQNSIYVMMNTWFQLY